MSGEQLTAKEYNKTSSVQLSKSNTASRVNIIDLLARVRQEKNKEKKENYIFFGLISANIETKPVHEMVENASFKTAFSPTNRAHFQLSTGESAVSSESIMTIL